MRARVKMLVALFLCVATLAAVLCGAIPASAVDMGTALSFGLPGRESNTEVNAAKLYQTVLGEEATPATVQYLEKEGIRLRYNREIPMGCISTDYLSEEGTLYVTVRPYRYTAENGSEVVWLPTAATLMGSPLALTPEDGVYTACVEGLFKKEDFEISVDFSWSVTVPRETVEQMQNGAYRAGSEALAVQDAYLGELAEYERMAAGYVAWQAYLERRAAYDAYLEALQAYEDARAAHENYLVKKALYDAELDAYLQWQSYYTALAAYHVQYGNYIAYRNYTDAMVAVDRKLTLMESIFIVDSNRWQMYSSIMGSTVTRVISNKTEIVDVLHCSEEDVDLAGVSTEALRVLLREYNAKRLAKYSTKYEKKAALYDFFVKNYDALELHFTNLYRTLKGFLSNSFVERALQSEGQRDHYLQFVGQLYVISTCLDADGERRSDWTVGGKPLEAVVEEPQRLPDGDWDPRLSPFPAYAEPAECPETVTPPAVSMPAQRPIEPTYAPPAGNAPAPVENPDDEGIPPQCDPPATEPPTAPVFDAVTVALMEEIRAGTLQETKRECEAYVYSDTVTLIRPVSILNQKLVNFYGIDGALLHSVMVNYGGAVSFAIPEHPESAELAYRPLAWVDAEGREADLHYIVTDLDLYPTYTTVKKSYTVTWQVVDANGVLTEASSTWSYGVTPTPNAGLPIASYEKNGFLYEFSGWETEIVPVTGDVTYRGTVTKRPKTYTVTWVVGEKTVTEVWEHGKTPLFSGEVAISSPSAEYVFLGWTPEISAVTQDATYAARYEVHPYATSGSHALEVTESDTEMTLDAGAHASVDFVRALNRALETEKGMSVVWESGCSLSFDSAAAEQLLETDCKRIVLQSFVENGDTVYEVHFYNGRLNDVALTDAAPMLSLPQDVGEDGSVLAFFLVEDGKETRIERSVIPVTGKTVIRSTRVYPLRVTPDANCNTGVLGYDATPGERISLDLACLPGYEVTGATVTDAKGIEIPVQNLSFVMPESAVTVTLNVEKMEYRVIFRCEGAVLSDTVYAFGDAIVQPKTPTKENATVPEGEMVYTFVSWGSAVPAYATGEVRELVFDAVFSAQIKDIDYDTGHNNNLLAEVILPVIGLCLVAIGGAATAIVLILRKRRR